MNFNSITRNNDLKKKLAEFSCFTNSLTQKKYTLKYYNNQ